MSAGLEAVALACARGGRTVFEGVSFALPPGSALLLTGPNGAGKSSLIRLLAGLLPRAGGRVLWDGADTAEEPGPFHRALRYLGHQDAVKPTLTVAANLGFWFRLAGGGDAGAALAAFGLDRLAGLPAGLLSAGQRRRLALARLLAGSPRLWLLDEPSVTLDADSVAALVRLVRAFRDGGGIVLAATHAELDLGPSQRLALGSRP